MDTIALLEAETQRLKSAICVLEKENNSLEVKNNSLEVKNTTLEAKSETLEKREASLEKKAISLESKLEEKDFYIAQLLRIIHGAKRERFIKNDRDPKQLLLPFDVEQDKDPQKQQETISYVRSKNNKKPHPGRMSFPNHLPVEKITIEPNEDTTGMKKIGEEVTEQLEMTPARLYIKRYIRPKYIKQDKSTDDIDKCKGVIAGLPLFPIEKCIAGASLLAQILIDKFVDHLPIYRQIERFKREGVKFSSSTINGWIESICNLLEPLYEAHIHRILSQGYLQVDETPIKVLDKQKKGKTHRGYYWGYFSPLEKSVLFDYRRGRGREGPKELLKDFRGYVQTDGYVVYDYLNNSKDIKHLNCMAHARREFEKALDNDRQRAGYAMDLFGKLYDVEREARENELSAQERKKLRLDKSLPVINELGKWMSQTYKTLTPSSPVRKAIAYCIPRWDNLMVYLYDGELEIDNNLIENSIRPIAIGRKNYLFAGSDRGAQRAAMMYSLLGTCKKNNVNPYEWLKKVLEVIPAHKANRLHELLPQNLKL